MTSPARARDASAPELTFSEGAGRPARPAPPMVGGYELLGVLGAGGMGVVHKARQVNVNRIVALKMVIGGAFASAELRARYKQEAEAAANLDHPNIVPVYEVGIEEGLHFFSMKLIDGKSLAEQLLRFRGQPRMAAAVVETVARAVHYAHQHGILHRDLKPSNILLDTANQPHVMDFGLAKKVQSNDDLTATGILIGTPRYMAPEQARAEKALTVAVDVWGLGTVLYELLTGVPPFKAETELDTILEVLQREPRRPRILDARIPRDLETICLKCLEKEPGRRYGSALEVAEELARWQRGEPILARPAGWLEKGWYWARRRPVIASLAFCLLFLTLASASAIAAAWLHALAGWREADANGQKAQREQLLAEQRREQTEQALYFSRIAQADLERQQNNPEDARKLLAHYADGSLEAHRQGWEWHYLQGLLNADLGTITAPHAEMVFSLAFHPGGDLLASGGGSPFRPFPPDRVSLWRAELAGSTAPIKEFAHPTLIRAVAFLEEGQRLAWIGEDHELRVVDVASGTTITRYPLSKGLRLPAFSGDGRLVATGVRQAGSRAMAVRVGEVVSGKETKVLNLSVLPFASVALNRDGKLIAVHSGQQLYWFEVATGKLLGQAESATGHESPAFSPDDALLALATRGGGVRVWDVATGHLRHHLAGHRSTVLATAFSPDGQRLATASADATVRLWDMQSGEELLLLRGHQGRAMSLAFHPSGRILASGSGQPSEVKLWDLTRHQDYLSVRTAESGPIRIEGLGFAANGQQLRVVRGSGEMQTVDAGTGIELHRRRVDVNARNDSPAWFAAFSASGNTLASVMDSDVRKVRLTDLASAGRQSILAHAYEVRRLRFSQNGQRLAVGTITPNRDGKRELVVWDTAEARRLATIFAPEVPFDGAIGALAIDDGGQWLAYDVPLPKKPGEPQGWQLMIHDLAAGQATPLSDTLPSPTESLAISRNGRVLAAGCDPGVFLLDAATGKRLFAEPLPGSSSDTFWDLAFSPDGRRLAAVSRTRTVLWDVATGTQVLTLQGSPPRMSDNRFNPNLAWSPDGLRLAATQWNRTAAIWDGADRVSPAAKAAMLQAARLRPGVLEVAKP